ncbi:MAG TPA: hypothetical protein VGO47_10885 [Chlamydiales bacterium]|nr:hypothetical protein [Chlamydiales bacterium]
MQLLYRFLACPSATSRRTTGSSAEQTAASWVLLSQGKPLTNPAPNSLTLTLTHPSSSLAATNSSPSAPPTQPNSSNPVPSPVSFPSPPLDPPANYTPRTRLSPSRLAHKSSASTRSSIWSRGACMRS